MKNQITAFLFLVTATAGVFVYVGSALVPIVHCHYQGKEAVAEVTAHARRTEGGVGTDASHEVLYYTLSFDGRRVEKRAGGKHPIGARFPVIYLPDDSTSVVQGSRAEGLWNTIMRSTNEIQLAITIGVGIVLLITAVKTLRAKAG
jgi:hypothetical protein